jgi:hypothetical protein
LKSSIKKIFFKCDKNDICQGFGETVFPAEMKVANPAENEVEEYMKNYQSTTRWQTV